MSFSLEISPYEKEQIQAVFKQVKASKTAGLETYEVQHAIDLVRKYVDTGITYKTDVEIFVEYFLQRDKLNVREGSKKGD